MQLQISLAKILERFPNISWTGKQKIAPARSSLREARN